MSYAILEHPSSVTLFSDISTCKFSFSPKIKRHVPQTCKKNEIFINVLPSWRWRCFNSFELGNNKVYTEFILVLILFPVVPKICKFLKLFSDYSLRPNCSRAHAFTCRPLAVLFSPCKYLISPFYYFEFLLTLYPRAKWIRRGKVLPVNENHAPHCLINLNSLLGSQYCTCIVHWSIILQSSRIMTGSASR